MFLDYQYKVILLFYFSCLHNIIDSQFTESPDQLLVACSGSTVNLRWNYITTDMLTLQWFSESTEMMSQIQANPPFYSNNYNQSIVEFVADAEISLKTLTAAFTGSYSCKVNYLSGNEYSNGTYLTVYDTFTSGLSCQYNGNAITCTQPDASVSLNATDEQGSEIIMNNPTKSGNYTICMQGDAIVCRGVFPTCTTVEVIIQGALTISYSGSNKLDSTTYILRCQIPGFDKQAAWSKDNLHLTSCLHTGCLTTIYEPYSFSHDNSAIYVAFSKLTTSEHNEQWTCEHGNLKTYFTVKVDSSKEGTIVTLSISCCAVIIAGLISGLLVVFTRFIPISRADAKRWYFPNRYICKGTVLYGIQIAVVGAVCQLLSILVTVLVIFCGYPGRQFSDLVFVVLIILFSLYPCLGLLVFRCFVAFKSKKELVHKIFDNKYERLSLTKSFGVKFTTHNSSFISFRIKTKKDAHIAVFGANYGTPLVDIILGFRDKLRSVVVEPNQREPKDEYREEVTSSTEYKTFYLKCEQNLITLLNRNEKTILTWKSDKNTSLEIKDIVISNSLQEHAAMTRKSISRFTKREIQVLCITMSKTDKYNLDNPEHDTTFWNDVCSSINRLHDGDDQKTADEIREMWKIIMSTTKATLAGDSICKFDSDSVLNSYSWIDEGSNYEGFKSPGSPESGEWTIFVRQGDRLDERDDDARCFKNFLLVIVVVFPIAWLVLLIIGLWRWCKTDDSTSNRENGIHECEYSCLRGSFCNKTSHLDKQIESSDNPPPYTVKYNRSDVPNKTSKKSQSSVSIEGRDIENRGNIESPSTGNVHDVMLDKNTTNRGNEKQVLTPITGVHPHIAGESKLNQKSFGTVLPLPPIDSPKEVKL